LEQVDIAVPATAVEAAVIVMGLVAVTTPQPAEAAIVLVTV
jgi:hypothetical protein